MKVTPIPVPPLPVEIEPLVSHRIEYHIGAQRVTFDVTGALVREIPPKPRSAPARVHPINRAAPRPVRR
jgi:hypothetical protein